MKILSLSAAAMAAGLLIAAPVFAQTTTDTVKPGTQTAQKQRTEGSGAGPASIGPGSGAYKQRTEGSGAGPASVGPGSGAYKQPTQSLSHSDGSSNGVFKHQ